VKRGKKEKQVNVQQENNFLFPDSPALASWEAFLLVLVWVRERGPKDDLKDTQEETGGVCSQSLGLARLHFSLCLSVTENTITCAYTVDTSTNGQGMWISVCIAGGEEGRGPCCRLLSLSKKGRVGWGDCRERTVSNQHLVPSPSWDDLLHLWS